MKKLYLISLTSVFLCAFALTAFSNKGVVQETEKSDKKIVVLDAGHGGYDEGGSYEGWCEKDITLNVALQVGKQLEAQGIEVLYTRKQDHSLGDDEKADLKARLAIAENAQATYFVSIHTNASQLYERCYGFEIWSNEQSAQSDKLAMQVGMQLEDLNYTMNRGIKDGSSSLYVLSNSVQPSILIELGFIDDSEDLAYMSDSAKQKVMSDAIARGIVNSL